MKGGRRCSECADVKRIDTDKMPYGEAMTRGYVRSAACCFCTLGFELGLQDMKEELEAAKAENERLKERLKKAIPIIRNANRPPNSGEAWDLHKWLTDWLNASAEFLAECEKEESDAV